MESAPGRPYGMGRVGSITSRCSGNEPTLILFSERKAGPEGAAEIEPMGRVVLSKKPREGQIYQTLQPVQVLLWHAIFWPIFPLCTFRYPVCLWSANRP